MFITKLKAVAGLLTCGLLAAGFAALPDSSLAQQPTTKKKDKPPAKKSVSSNRLKARATLEGHKDQVNSVAFSPDGKLLASASSDRTIKIWDTATGKELRTLTGHDASVMAVAFSPDGKSLASVAYQALGFPDMGAMLWDVATWEAKVKLERNKGSFESVVFSADSKIVAAAGSPAALLWDTSTGKQVGAIYDNQGRATSAAFSPDGKILVLGIIAPLEDVEPIRLWDWKEPKRLQALKADPRGGVPEQACHQVAFLKDGKTLITLTGKLTYWDFDKMKPIKKIGPKEYHPFFGTAPSALSPDEKTLAQTDLRVTGEGKFHFQEGVVRLWSVPKNQELESIPIDAQGKCIAFSPKGDILAVGCSPKGKNPRGNFNVQYEGGAVIRLWDVRDSGRAVK
jgi:WD40 repeat protein